MSALINLTNISKAFLTEEIETRALNGINLTIEQGEYVSLSGQSGCGKSTLLSLLGLLDAPTQGQYMLAGSDVSQLSRDQRATIRSEKIGFVFQSFNLISDLSVFENVMLPLTYQSGLNKAEITKRVDVVLEKVEMSHRKNHFPSQLSGGQQQRVAVARALVNDPAIILADEPTGNLDSKNAQAVLALFDKLHQEGATICMVTHDPASAKRASRCLEMFDGCLIKDQRNVNNTAPSHKAELAAS
ncbi:ABC transporter ATP-binding protein [Psychrobium sp. 1_MG-2023]|uniref:ABC transporter ATP-binding protein n=1 Tax=Psychrobium sp. 1_MG-2023 TaxID=3062624 RepID=UPI000C34DA8A|nr:ABC transporter ATP-binding protein [Psychrobium sp. 1_MG-2023]MDP2562591.1 ABC transporter ATP-binding protein [Psychrobium sp. 1_MG-2023]PKF59644.1 ABC transporter ATP-binding protein [Alteromonadales bacterium alter-6D02]